MRNLIQRTAMLLVVTFVVSCGGGSSGSSSNNSSSSSSSSSGSYSIVNGVAQKGPLQIGSAVTVAELDTDLNPTGKIYLTQVKDSLGNFLLGSQIGSKLVLIQAVGYYMDENTGNFTNSSITLRGISDLSIESSPTVNVLTTLQYIRLKNLINGGMAYQDAYQQSQKEVLAAFNVNSSAVSGFSSLYQMRINGNSDSDAVLLAIASTLSKAAALRNSSSTAAELSDIINTIASDISQSGNVSRSIANELKAAQIALDSASIRSNVANFYAARGVSVTPPIFEDWVSKDGSGVLPARTQAKPSDYSFARTNNALPSQSYTSQSVTISGLSDSSFARASVSAGVTLIKNSLPVSGSFATVTNGDVLSLKMTSASYGGAVSGTLNVGASSATWELVSQSPGSVTPNTFTLTQVNNSVPNQSYTSNEVVIGGLSSGEVAYVTSSSGSTINKNGVATGLTLVIGQNGDRISLTTNGPPLGTSASYDLTIGTRTTIWNLVAQSPTTVTPDAFSLTSVAGEVGQVVTSNAVTVSGLRSGEVAQVNLTTTGSATSSVNLLVNGNVVGTLPTIVNQGDVLAIRSTLSNAFGASGSVTMRVGTRAVAWNLSTRLPTSKYYRRFGSPNTLIQDIYTSGTTDAYYGIPFVASSSFKAHYFALGVYNGNVTSVSIYSDNSGVPGSLLSTATVSSIFTDTSPYTYLSGGYTQSGSSTTFKDALGNLYWISSKIQGKFSNGINLFSGTRYWIVIHWDNGFPHDQRVDASPTSSWDFSRAYGSADGVTWSPINLIGSPSLVPSLFITD